MRIVAIETRQVEMPHARPYTIAYETIERTTNIFVRVRTSSGVTGFGCAAPDLAVTGETPESVLDSFRNVIEPALHAQDPLRIARHVRTLEEPLRDHPSALAGIDMALYDILGKVGRLPVWRLLGGYRNSILTSVTIGIMPVEETVGEALDWVARGFHCLKIKGGRILHDDIEKTLKVREAVGEHVRLRFDANQGYSVKDALAFVRATKSASLELLEQPTPSRKPDLLGRVTTRVPLPIMADESLMNLRDAFRLARKELVDMVNIKLMKVGGIHLALQIDSVARSANLRAMIGSMDEAGLGIAAGLHFALARPNVAFADLDGHLGLLGDPTHDAVVLRKGMLYSHNRPGLGFDVPWN